MSQFNHNNLKAKARNILTAYELEMSINEVYFFIHLSNADYITDKDKENFLLSDFRYRAFQSGII